ncbi:MAG: hypothetical protein DMG58_18205 [Acidobacteria bacterium]|nr:MAG: hypothetical protein DMG58_18205 [Acidobacteriota bacterium]
MAPGFAGLYQINLRVPPSTPSGDQIPLKISAASLVPLPQLHAVEICSAFLNRSLGWTE